MASYTMPLRDMIEQPTQFIEGLTFDQRIEAGRKAIFDFDYPQLNSTFKKKFETDFLLNFYTREIGFETEFLFKVKLRNWLNMNMPYWVKMLETDDLIKEPLVNVNWTRILDTTKDAEQKNVASGTENMTASDSASSSSKSTDTATATNKSFTRDIKTDTPESRLQITTGADGTGVIEYATAITEDKVNSEGSSNSTNSSSSEGSGKSQSEGNSSSKLNIDSNEVGYEKEHTKGNMGMKTESEMIELYRRILMKWEPMIFAEMEQLFMLVY